MRFTSPQIKHIPGLGHYIRRHVSPVDSTVHRFLYNVYDTEHVINALEWNIQKHTKRPSSSTKFIPTWKQHIKALKEFENGNSNTNTKRL